MASDFDRILDECIDRINNGESLDACLGNYPAYAERLKPSLVAMLAAKRIYSFLPSADTKRAARQNFHTALEAAEHRQEAGGTFFHRLLGGPRVWATAAAVLLIAIVGYWGLRPLLFPTGTFPQPGPPAIVATPVPDPDGNFVFLISDDVNAISEFESVDVSISSIGLLASDTPDRWLEFEPEVAEVDLTLVPGDKTQEIWRGNIPQGEYSKVFIYVSEARGILKETGREVEVKLPGQKLHISKQFQISNDAVTSFTYDLTVVAAGSSPGGPKYILKPQVEQSGADQRPGRATGKGSGRGG